MSPQFDPEKRHAAASPTDAATKPGQANESRQTPPPKGDANLPAGMQGQRPAPAAAEQWREPEHQAPAADLEAKQLLDKTGSPALAKHAVDQLQSPADEPVSLPTAVEQDDAARQFGFESFAGLVKDSVAFPVERGATFMVCELNDGRWIRFDRESWPDHEIFPSRDEAMRPIAST